MNVDEMLAEIRALAEEVADSYDDEVIAHELAVAVLRVLPVVSAPKEGVDRLADALHAHVSEEAVTDTFGGGVVQVENVYPSGADSLTVVYRNGDGESRWGRCTASALLATIVRELIVAE